MSEELLDFEGSFLELFEFEEEEFKIVVQELELVEREIIECESQEIKVEL